MREMTFEILRPKTDDRGLERDMLPKRACSSLEAALECKGIDGDFIALVISFFREPYPFPVVRQRTLLYERRGEEWINIQMPPTSVVVPEEKKPDFWRETACHLQRPSRRGGKGGSRPASPPQTVRQRFRRFFKQTRLRLR